MANSHGGARPGAGRKPKAIKYESQIRKAEKRIADKLPWVVDKLLELGEGVVVQEMGLAGPVVYQKPPDRDALKYLADRIMGKPTERQEISGPDEGPIPLEVATVDYRNGLAGLEVGSIEDSDAPGEG